MNRLGKALLIVVLLSLLAVPAAAKPDAEGYSSESLYVYTPDSFVDVNVYDYPPYWSGSTLYVSTPTFSCYLEPSPIGVPGMQGASAIKLAFTLPGAVCMGSPPSEVVVDLTLTPDLVTHGNSHQNVVVGDQTGMKCQSWYKNGSNISGSIGGVPVSGDYFYGYADECTFK